MDAFTAIGKMLSLSLLACGILFGIAQQQAPISEPVTLRAAEVAPAFSAYIGDPLPISVHTPDGLSLSHAYVLVNGERRGDLGDGILTVYAAAGDILSFDTSAYMQTFTLTVEPLSARIDRRYLMLEVPCTNGTGLAGTVVIREL